MMQSQTFLHKALGIQLLKITFYFLPVTISTVIESSGGDYMIPFCRYENSTGPSRDRFPSTITWGNKFSSRQGLPDISLQKPIDFH